MKKAYIDAHPQLSWPWLVATADLQPLLEKGIAALNVEHDDGRGIGTQKAGGVQALANRVSQIRKESTPEAVCRRVYEMRKGTSAGSRAEMADAIALALDTTLANEGIPTFAANQKAAEEMVETMRWRKGESFDEINDRKLARSLKNFTYGYLNWDKVVVEEVKEEEAAA